MKNKWIIMSGVSITILLVTLTIWSFVPGDSPLEENSLESAENDNHSEESERSEERVVRLNEAEMKEFRIEVGKAGPGKLQVHVTLPGEVVVNADRVAHIVPPVAGVVSEVRKTLGDKVRAGEAMAILKSRELAEAKAAFLAAGEQLKLAEAKFIREEDLWNKKISSEEEYLEAKQGHAEERIELHAAEQKLHALGFSEEYLAKLSQQPDISFTRYEIVAPFSGTIIEKHISLGEVLGDDAEAFIIADLSVLWVNLSVYQKDLPFVRKRQPVVISGGYGLPDETSEISFVGPLVGEETRTAIARIILPNAEGLWRPGMFVKAKIEVGDLQVDLVIPKSALQTVGDQTSVFVKTEEGFEPRAVTLGQSNETQVEIISGIQPGQEYVTSGAFTLSAQLSKGAFGDGHGH
jgi:cobalt-zinc-cadmium efflux system membrane fusion protein